MKVLIIEDDVGTAELLKRGLAAEGYTAEVTWDGKQGLFMGRNFTFDLIIMDYSLPNRNGIEVCQELRKAGISTPVLFLTVEDDIDIKIDAFNHGADDYLLKPFSLKELLARTRALLRRPRELIEEKIEVDDLTIDTRRRIAYRSGKEISMTRKEYNLLEYMVKNAGSVLSRSLLMENVWTAESNPFSNTVEAHIRNLRRKINTGGRPDLISNIPGRGYVLKSRKKVRI